MAMKPKTKWTFTGWMGAREEPYWLDSETGGGIGDIPLNRQLATGVRLDIETEGAWPEDEWPPRKVRVTVEVIE